LTAKPSAGSDTEVEVAVLAEGPHQGDRAGECPLPHWSIHRAAVGAVEDGDRPLGCGGCVTELEHVVEEDGGGRRPSELMEHDKGVQRPVGDDDSVDPGCREKGLVDGGDRGRDR
jgi:hypothetical protein